MAPPGAIGSLLLSGASAPLTTLQYYSTTTTTTTSSWPVLTVRSTPFELVTSDLSESRLVLLTNLVVWLLALVSGLFLGLRLFAVWYRKLVLVIDDGLLIAAWVAVLFYAATTSLELAVGTTTASTTTTTHPAVTLLDNTARTLALASVAWSKSAFACGLLGLRPVRTYRWVLLTMVGVLNAVVVGAAVFHWVRCRPISRAWDGGEGGFCFGVDARNGVQIAAQGYFSFMDMVLVGISYTLVWSGDLRPGEKLGIGLLATQGVIASIASIMTAVEISTLTETTTTFTSNIRVLLPASLEAPLTIIISSLPALQLLLRQTTPAPPHKNTSAHPSTAGPPAFGPATPTTNPFSGFRPPRPARPTSARSFMTEASARSHHPQQQQQHQKKSAADRWMAMTMGEPGGAAIITTNITSGPGAVNNNNPLSPVEDDRLPGREYEYNPPNHSSPPTQNPNKITIPSSFPPIPNTPRAQHPPPPLRRPSTGRSTTSNNSTTALLTTAPREHLSPSSSSSSPPRSPSPPSSPSYSPLPPSSAGIGGLFPRPAPSVVTVPPTTTAAAAAAALPVASSDSSDDENNRRLTIVREEASSSLSAAPTPGAAVPSWGSSAVRSSVDGAASLLDLYTNAGNNDNSLPAAPAAVAGGSGGAHVAMRSRDSPTLGDWSKWKAASASTRPRKEEQEEWKKEEQEEWKKEEVYGDHDLGGSTMYHYPGTTQQQQERRRFPVKPSGRPLHARQRLPPETGLAAPAGWTQKKMFGE